MNIGILNAQTEKSFLQHYTGQIQLFLYDLTCDYPFFGEWLKKALSEIVTGRRTVVILTQEGNPQRVIGLTILKTDPQEKKICTIRIHKDYQRRGYGTQLVKKSLEILGTSTPLATVSEKHIAAFKPFFRQFGFNIVGKVKSLYHIGEFEYFFNIPYIHRNVLISIKPQYAMKILSGEKTVEVRRKSFPYTIQRAYIYASTPVRRIVGYIDVDSQDTDTPEVIWNRYKELSSIIQDDYDKYADDCCAMTAILIKRAYAYDNPLSIEEVLGDRASAPQNYCYIDNVSVLKRMDVI